MARNRTLLLVIALTLTPPAASAANPCRTECRTTKKACVAPVQATFVAAKAACRALATGAERKPCLAAARAEKKAAKALCKTAFKECASACGPTNSGGKRCGSREADWLATVNLYRTLAGLPTVTERPEWSAGALAHAQYTVAEDTVGHTQDPMSPHATPEGAASAATSNVAGHSSPTQTFGWAIDSWMTGPFHAVGIIDPRLVETGFGIAHDQSGTVRTGAVLDVINGRTGALDAIGFPVVYPANGTALPLDRYAGNEAPDPLTACPGYEAPTGPPLIVQFGSSEPTPAIADVVLTRDGTPVPVCVFDGTNYVNSEPAFQASGRSVLAGRGAVVLMPRDVLVAGSTYGVQLTADGLPLAWSFTVACP